MMHMGDIMSTVGGVQHGTEHPPLTPYCIHIIQGENLTKSKEIVRYFPFLKAFHFHKIESFG